MRVAAHPPSVVDLASGGGDREASHITHAATVRLDRSAQQSDAAGPHSAFLPVLLGGLALAGMLAFQTFLLTGDRTSLRATHTAQQRTVDSAGQLRNSLDALAADTQRMADGGNANAALLVTELRKRGITINPSAAATPAAQPAMGSAPTR